MSEEERTWPDTARLIAVTLDEASLGHADSLAATTLVSVPSRLHASAHVALGGTNRHRTSSLGTNLHFFPLSDGYFLNTALRIPAGLGAL